MQLAGFWPNGFMDNHGIKRAICRAKDRRRALHARRKVKMPCLSNFSPLFSLLSIYLIALKLRACIRSGALF